MGSEFERTEYLLGHDNIEHLNHCRVAVFGIGGVGGHAAEALVRSGIGTIDLIDNDVVSKSNINRQIVALHSTIGKSKVEVMKDRVLDINPHVVVNTYNEFFSTENANKFDFSSYDYIVDAIDTVTGKIELVVRAKESGTKIISSMGAGNKLDPTAFLVSDIYKTSVCPLARVMRRELKSRGIDKLKVVYSKEQPLTNGERVPGSTAFVPSVVGLIIAGEVIKDLCDMG